MKKYLIVGLVLATMFTTVACGSKAVEEVKEVSKVMEEAKIAVASEEYEKARNLFKLASDEVSGEEKTLATSSYKLLESFIFAEKAVEDGDLEEAKLQLKKIESNTTYENLVEDIKALKVQIEERESLDSKIEEKLQIVSNFLEEKKLEEAKKTFAEINLEGLSDEANKKYADMSLEIKALEEKVEATKKAEADKEKVEDEKKENRDKLFNGTSKIYIDYEDSASIDSFESFMFRKLETGELEVSVGSEKACPSGTLRKIADTSWTGSLYDSAFGMDAFYDVVTTENAIKIIQSSDQNVRTIILYLKSQTYETTNTNSEITEKGSFTLK